MELSCPWMHQKDGRKLEILVKRVAARYWRKLEKFRI